MHSELSRPVIDQIFLTSKYNLLNQQPFPYICHTNQQKFSSQIINTDQNGFRIGGNSVKSENRYVFTGGSCCFGWGATSDYATVPEIFSRKINYPCKNLGVMGGNSLMELMSLVPYINHGPGVISITGLNTLVTNVLSKFFPPSLSSEYEELMPFNNFFWANVSKNDILTATAHLAPTFDASTFFKNANQKINYKTSMFYSYFARLFLGKKKFCAVKDHLTSCEIDDAVSTAISNLTRDMIAISRIFDKHLVVLQPYLLTNKQRMSDAENELLGFHLKQDRPTYLNKLFYEIIPSVYDSYICAVEDKLNEVGLRTIKIMPPYKEWFFSDLVHYTDYGNSYIAGQVHNKLMDLAWLE